MGNMIFLTGATGFLGAQIARLLLQDKDCEIAALVRGADPDESARRLERAWSDWPETKEALAAGRVRVLNGDVSLPKLGLDPDTYTGLVSKATHILHSAAELKLEGELEDLRRTNVGGTANLLELARAVQADHGLKRYAHVSTAYVAGGRTGEVAEDELTESYGFTNAYEQTKFEAELLVRQAMPELPVSVFRPGMIVGDSRTGEIKTFNTVYVPLRLYLMGKLHFIPSNPEMKLNLVPVDYVADSIACLLFDPRAIGLTFHLTVDAESQPRVSELVDIARRWAEKELGEAPAQARFISMRVLEHLTGKNRLPVPACLLSYFNENRQFLRDHAESLLGAYIPNWEAIIPKLLEYAVRRGFLHKSGRTVHEQVLQRIQSRSLPVRVHDIPAEGREQLRGGQELAREIAEAAGALKTLGIRAGDRVALVGLNSSRYLALDTAIGITGAVSVPLYYTSPPSEIEELLNASGACMLLVGAPNVLKRISEIKTRIPVVSFLRDAVPCKLEDRVIPWDEFLAIGRKHSPPTAPRVALEAPVGFGDPATVRYTSGTTGTPRGVAFRHSQLLWLAETVNSLFPWKTRTRPARYLSFLPMNHVVEGIMGTYTPYFLPAPVDVWLLEDFFALSRALPRVRPTVFFSVPRFYEKIWERFAAKPLGRFYLGLPQNSLRGALRPLVRRTLLRKAGLDRCAQLIVGSAPCPDSLLSNFRELGIEVHNAFGMTEAPLVTLNRLGANRIGTVGTPLPETQLSISSEGEVLVRGPQVAGKEGEWLATGDLGEITPGGSLVIRGRKKDILVTSYGKNICPTKIEEMLREIPEVAEAMVVGEGRPALCAMLWPKVKGTDPEAMKSIDLAIRKLNQNLSHPEQLKRWAVLTDKPSIENGELTGNLKLRKQVVLDHHTLVMDLLYNQSQSKVAQATEVLHVGAI
jgi:long-chain acyl-CoA synthetase